MTFSHLWVLTLVKSMKQNKDNPKQNTMPFTEKSEVKKVTDLHHYPLTPNDLIHKLKILRCDFAISHMSINILS